MPILCKERSSGWPREQLQKRHRHIQRDLAVRANTGLSQAYVIVFIRRHSAPRYRRHRECKHPARGYPIFHDSVESNVPPTYQEALPASNASTAGVAFSVNAPGIQSGVSSSNSLIKATLFGDENDTIGRAPGRPRSPCILANCREVSRRKSSSRHPVQVPSQCPLLLRGRVALQLPR